VKIIQELSATRNAMFKVKHWNCNNSTAYCSVAFKIGTEFPHVTGDTLQNKVKGPGHGVKGQGQGHSVK